MNHDTYCVGFFGNIKKFNIALLLSCSECRHRAVLFVVDYGPSQINSSKYFQLNRQHHRETKIIRFYSEIITEQILFSKDITITFSYFVKVTVECM
jgi:hypothetical protein